MNVKFKKWKGTTWWSHYPDGGAPALLLKGGEELIAVATVNVPDFVPAKGCVCIKDYGENEGMVEALKHAGVLRDQNAALEIPSGHVVIGMWALTPEALAEYNASGRTPADAEGAKV